MTAELQIISKNRRHYPTQAGVCLHSRNPHEHLRDPDGDGWCGEPPPTMVVLVEGEIGDYAAYIGHGDADWVARHGDKLSFEEALCHFPIGLKREKYRS